MPRGVAALSSAYNAGSFPIRWTPELSAARLHFFLPRDQAKLYAAVANLPLPPSIVEAAEIRIFDFGCGIGASALGVIRALRHRGLAQPIRVDLHDTDRAAVSLATNVLALLPNVQSGLATYPPNQTYHLVIFGQVLVEVAGRRPAGDANAEVLLQHAVNELLEPEGAVIVVEPALREATRRLHRVRDGLVDSGRVHVWAPCPHDHPCPMLANPKDWCHEDLAIDLPQWLHPIAREAGLRWQGLTFARLVLSRVSGARPPLRVVAQPRNSKGRQERLLCGVNGGDLAWVDRLDKHRGETNVNWDSLERGDGLELVPAEKRVGPNTAVHRWPRKENAPHIQNSDGETG
jgi:SAM-dependent methyltransferase